LKQLTVFPRQRHWSGHADDDSEEDAKSSKKIHNVLNAAMAQQGSKDERIRRKEGNPKNTGGDQRLIFTGCSRTMLGWGFDQDTIEDWWPIGARMAYEGARLSEKILFVPSIVLHDQINGGR
jgi:hypothetical protein